MNTEDIRIGIGVTPAEACLWGWQIRDRLEDDELPVFVTACDDARADLVVLTNQRLIKLAGRPHWAPIASGDLSDITTVDVRSTQGGNVVTVTFEDDQLSIVLTRLPSEAHLLSRLLEPRLPKVAKPSAQFDRPIQALAIPRDPSQEPSLVTVDASTALSFYPYVSGGPVEAARVTLNSFPEHELYVNSHYLDFPESDLNDRATMLLEASGVVMAGDAIRGDALLVGAVDEKDYPASIDPELAHALTG